MRAWVAECMKVVFDRASVLRAALEVRGVDVGLAELLRALGASRLMLVRGDGVLVDGGGPRRYLLDFWSALAPGSSVDAVTDALVDVRLALAPAAVQLADVLAKAAVELAGEVA
jgi:hypothetical protein